MAKTNKLTMKQIIFFLALLLSFFSLFAQAPGDLDLNFLQTGQAYIDHSSLANHFNATAIQPDGKIIVVGQADGHPFIGRMLPNGSWDMSFGFAGVWMDYQSPQTELYDVAIAPNGNIYATGYENLNGNVDYAIVIALLDNGLINATFGTGGYVKKDIQLGKNFGKSILVQADGKILMGGGSARTSPSTGITTEGKFIFRFNIDGTDDVSFGAGTGHVIPQMSGAYGHVTDIAIYNGTLAASYATVPNVHYNTSATSVGLFDLADGFEVTTATCNYYSGTGRQGLSRIAFAADGTLWAAMSYFSTANNFNETDFYKIDANQSNATYNIFAYTYYFQEATAILPIQNGFLVAGPTEDGGKSDIVNLGADGLLNFGFATQGIFQTDANYNANIRDMKFTPNGKLVAVGISPSIYHASNQSIDNDGFAMRLYTQNSTALSPKISEQLFSIFPNPNNGNFTIQFKQLSTQSHISLLDITGRKLCEQSDNKHAESIEMNVPNLCNGIYWITVENEQGISSQKILIQH